MKSKPSKKTTSKPKETVKNNQPQEKSHESVKKPSMFDWDMIEQEYRAGQLSISEIAARHGASQQAVSIRAKRKGWTRNLAARVRKRVAEKLVVDVVGVVKDNATDSEIEEAAAERGAGIVRLHRKDIANLRRLEESLINELQDNPTKLYLAQYQGIIIQKTVSLTVSERAMAANNLANVQHKRIALERQAYNIDPDEKRPDPVEEININFIQHIVNVGPEG